MGPPKDFQGGPDACVHLTSKPVLSKCPNQHKRSANVARTSWGAKRGALRGALRGTRRGALRGALWGGPSFGEPPHSRTYLPFGF